MSQEALGEAAGVHKNTINRLETGKQTIGLGTLYEIAAALEVDPDDLLRQSSGETATGPLLAEYQASPWAQIDKPTTEEIEALAEPVSARWFGAEADAEAVHHILMAMRKRKT